MTTEYRHAPTGTITSAREKADEVTEAARAAGFNVQVCYGYATSADHNNKRCVDFMIAGKGSEEAGGKRAGVWIADYLWIHRKRLGLNWEIWNRAIRRHQNTSRPLNRWANYSGPSPHTDHVHAEFDSSAYVPLKATPPKPTPAPADPPVVDPTKGQARVLTINCRLSSVKDSHPWSGRKAAMVKLLAETPASVIGVQECSDDIRTAMLTALGREWRVYRHAKVGLLYDGSKWERLAAHEFDMDNEAEPDRRLILVQLKHKASGRATWFGVSHFGVHYRGEQAERINQAKEVLGHVKDLGISEGVILGDFNDSPRPPAIGVRTTFQGPKGVLLGVFYDLRHCIAKVKNGAYSTHHGYKPTPRNGRWLDDILTSENVVVLEAGVILTDPDSEYPNATDHNVLSALIQF